MGIEKSKKLYKTLIFKLKAWEYRLILLLQSKIYFIRVYR